MKKYSSNILVFLVIVLVFGLFALSNRQTGHQNQPAKTASGFEISGSSGIAAVSGSSGSNGGGRIEDVGTCKISGWAWGGASFGP